MEQQQTPRRPEPADPAYDELIAELQRCNAALSDSPHTAYSEALWAIYIYLKQRSWDSEGVDVLQDLIAGFRDLEQGMRPKIFEPAEKAKNITGGRRSVRQMESMVYASALVSLGGRKNVGDLTHRAARKLGIRRQQLETSRKKLMSGGSYRKWLPRYRFMLDVAKPVGSEAEQLAEVRRHIDRLHPLTKV